MRALVLATCLAAASATAEDLTIVSKLTRDGAAAGTSTSYLTNDHIRMAQTEGQEFLLDAQSGNMTVIDTKKKEYYVTTAQDIAAMTAKLQEQMKKMDEQMKNMPPQAREMMAKMTGGMGASLSVQKTGAAKKIAGYSCEGWTITMGEMMSSEQCISGEVPIPTQAWTRYKELAESLASIGQSLGPMGKGIAEMQEKMKGMQGFPLSHSTSVKAMGKSSTNTSEVTEIKRGPIPASAFELPAGFKRVDSPMKKMIQ